MSEFYDPNLKHKLPANNSSDIVLNQEFASWTDHVVNAFSTHSSDGGKRYSEGKDKKLLQYCQEHAAKYQGPKISRKTLMIVHPFYMQLTHMNQTRDSGLLRDGANYLDSLLNVLNHQLDRSKVNVVVLELIHHYAAATSLLMEKGLVDQTIFTVFNEGVPLKVSELAKFAGDDVYFAGAYNRCCVYGAIGSMEDEMRSGNIFGIPEIMLNSPQAPNHSLKPTSIRGLKSEQVISLEDALRDLAA